jgi:hypothetical protein
VTGSRFLDRFVRHCYPCRLVWFCTEDYIVLECDVCERPTEAPHYCTFRN